MKLLRFLRFIFAFYRSTDIKFARRDFTLTHSSGVVFKQLYRAGRRQHSLEFPDVLLLKYQLASLAHEGEYYSEDTRKEIPAAGRAIQESAGGCTCQASESSRVLELSS